MSSYPSGGDTSQAGCERSRRAAQLLASGALPRSVVLSLAAVWLIGLLCGSARADYDALVKQALSADAAGEFERAHALFEQAHAIQPNARTLRGMGVASYQAGQLVRAVAELEAALVHSEKPLEGELRAATQGLLARARAQLGSVELHVVPRAARVRVDAEAEARASGAPLLLVPGLHRLQIAAGDYLAQELELNVAAGARHVLSVSLVPAPRALARAALPASDSAERRAPRAPWQARAAWSTLAVAAGAGMVAGSLFLTAHTRVARIAEACGATVAQQCTPEQRDEQLARARLEGLERGANVALGVAGAALLLGTGALVAWRVRGKRAARAARPWLRASF